MKVFVAREDSGLFKHTTKLFAVANERNDHVKLVRRALQANGYRKKDFIWQPARTRNS